MLSRSFEYSFLGNIFESCHKYEYRVEFILFLRNDDGTSSGALCCDLFEILVVNGREMR